MSFKESLSGVGLILYGLFIFICFFVLYPIGLVHTYRHHSGRAFDWAWVPPVGMYRGAESFWHKPQDEYISSNSQDDQPIDWSKRTTDDISTASTLILMSDDTKDMDDEKMQMESLSQKISKYPDSSKQKIASGVRCFLEYNLRAADDVNNYVKDLITDSTAQLRFKSSTLQAYDSLANYYKMAEAIQIKNAMDSVMANTPFKSLDANELKGALEKSKAIMASHEEVYKRFFKEIFDENFN